MVFSSLTFLYFFLPSCLGCYLLARGIPAKNIVLTVFSLFFYAWGEPIYVGLMLLTAAFNYYTGLLIDRNRQTGKSKLYLILTALVNLGILGVFKYLGFLAGTLSGLTGMDLSVPEIALPIGISFYTFQTLSYSIDLYRGEVKVQQSYIKLLMYISLFPQLIAGPIVRYREVEREISCRNSSIDRFGDGASRFACGLAKKVLIANTCGQCVDMLLVSPAQASVLGTYLGVLFFTFQIYFDFSGYSDMAIGLGRMLGFRFDENFNYPYISKSASEFWRRWHISLGSFFRDYVYIPLGGNRKNYFRNLFVVWFLTGLWHGASWNFVLWGLYYGALIAMEHFFLGDFMKRLPSWIAYIYMVVVTVFGWTIFYYTDFTQLGEAISTMLGCSELPFSNGYALSVLRDNGVLLLASVIASLPLGGLLLQRFFTGEGARFGAAWPVLRPLLILASLFICTALLVGKSYNPFLYFRF